MNRIRLLTSALMVLEMLSTSAFASYALSIRAEAWTSRGRTDSTAKYFFYPKFAVTENFGPTDAIVQIYSVDVPQIIGSNFPSDEFAASVVRDTVEEIVNDVPTILTRASSARSFHEVSTPSSAC